MFGCFSKTGRYNACNSKSRLRTFYALRKENPNSGEHWLRSMVAVGAVLSGRRRGQEASQCLEATRSINRGPGRGEAPIRSLEKAERNLKQGTRLKSTEALRLNTCKSG